MEEKINAPLPLEDETPRLRDMRNKIIAGIFIVIPVSVSLWLGITAFRFITAWAADLVSTLPIPDTYKQSGFFMLIIRILSIFLMLVFLYLVGHIAKYAAGKKLISYTENLMLRVPMLKTVYSTVSQILDTIKASKSGMFTQAVLFEYPRKGIYSIAFVTNWEVSKMLSEQLDEKELIAVFLPTTPNPTSGFFLIVPKKDCIFLNIGIDNAMKMIISGGALQPQQNGNINQNNIKELIQKEG